MAVGVFYFLDKQRSGRKRLIYDSDGWIFCSAEVLHEEMCSKSRDARAGTSREVLVAPTQRVLGPASVPRSSGEAGAEPWAGESSQTVLGR